MCNEKYIFIKNKVLYTPSLDLGILAGIMRSLIIDIARDLNLEVKNANTIKSS